MQDVRRQPPAERAEAMSPQEHADWYHKQALRQASHNADLLRRAVLEERLEALRAEADAICDALRLAQPQQPTEGGPDDRG